MNKSDEIGNLAKALAKVQGALRPAVKSESNPFYNSKYADLSGVWEACRELLSKNGLAVVQTTQPSVDGVIVDTTLIHESSEWISGSLLIPLAKKDPQGVVAGVTYARRAGLAAICGVTADADDDGNSISQPAQSQQRQAPPPSRQPRQNEAGSALQAPRVSNPDAPMSDKQSKAIWAIAKAKGYDENEFIAEFFDGALVKAELSAIQASAVIESLNAS